MKDILKISILWLLDILGINALCRWLHRDKAIILYYHGICDDSFNLLKGYDDRHITRSGFKEQLAYLQRKGYSFASMTELVNTMKNGGKLGRKVALTFDDGFRNVVRNAYPIMREFDARGCFYLVTALIGTGEPVWTDYVETVIRSREPGQYQFNFNDENITYNLTDKKSYEHAMKDIKAKLRTIPNVARIEHLKQFGRVKPESIPEEFFLANWEEIKGLSPDVLEIGSHTRNHSNCANFTSEAEYEEEIHQSKKDIEDVIRRKVAHFCYPAGSFNREAIDKARQSGYQSAVTVENGFVDNHSELYQLKRIAPSENLLIFKSRISGSNIMLRRIRALK